MRRVIRKRIRRSGDGVDLAADLNVTIDANVGRKTVPAPRRPDTSEDDRSDPRDSSPAPDRDEQGEEP